MFGRKAKQQSALIEQLKLQLEAEQAKVADLQAIIKDSVEERPNEFECLKDLFIVRATNFPCERCNIETKHCKKLIFADRTICVAPKDKVNTFQISEKRKKQILKK